MILFYSLAAEVLVYHLLNMNLGPSQTVYPHTLHLLVTLTFTETVPPNPQLLKDVNEAAMKENILLC